MVDVTSPNGPGVNEREFLLSLYRRLGDRMHAVLPRPRRACDEIDPARTTFYRNPSRWNAVGFLLQQYELARNARRLLATGQFDLMVVRLSILPLAIFAIRRTATPYALKTVGEVQGLTRAAGWKGLAAKAIAPLNWRLWKGIIDSAVAVDACTETLARRHREDFSLTGDEILMVENATNVERFAPRDMVATKRSLGLLRFDQILGFVGGAPADRGGMQMLEVAVRLQGDYPKLGVAIVGGDKSGALARRSRELGIEDRTVLPGVVPYDAIPTYVNSFDIGFALDRPEPDAGHRQLVPKVRQYLACGKPVVTCMDNDSDLMRQGLVQNASPDDLDALERAVRALLERDAHTCARHAKRATKFVRERLSTGVHLGATLGVLAATTRRCVPP